MIDDDVSGLENLSSKMKIVEFEFNGWYFLGTYHDDDDDDDDDKPSANFCYILTNLG
jgi:regulator of RNase E activity RraB